MAVRGIRKFTYEVSENDVFLVDVRSEPGRDARGHVVDHGYVYASCLKTERLKCSPMFRRVMTPSQARLASKISMRCWPNPLAFDHSQLLTKVRQALEDGAA